MKGVASVSSSHLFPLLHLSLSLLPCSMTQSLSGSGQTFCSPRGLSGPPSAHQRWRQGWSYLLKGRCVDGGDGDGGWLATTALSSREGDGKRDGVY